jgi:hypothetical protein
MRSKLFKTDLQGIETCVKNLSLMKQTFVVEKKRKNIYIYKGKSGLMSLERDFQKSVFKNTDKKTKAKAISLIGNVKRAAERYCIKKGLDIQPIPHKHPSLYRNWNVIDNMKFDEEFYYIDIKHCYWRLAYLMGIIPKSIYEGKGGKELKLYRNMALSCLFAPKTRITYIRGKKISEFTEHTEIFDTLYSNIRHQAWNFIGDLKDELKDKCIGYRTDAIMVFPDSVDFVKSRMEESALLYDSIQCFFINQKTFYTADGEIKRF